MTFRLVFSGSSTFRIMKALAIVGTMVGVIVFLLQPNESQGKTKKGPLVTEKVSDFCIKKL